LFYFFITAEPSSSEPITLYTIIKKKVIVTGEVQTLLVVRDEGYKFVRKKNSLGEDDDEEWGDEWEWDEEEDGNENDQNKNGDKNKKNESKKVDNKKQNEPKKKK
jgi:hypothetical protein